MKRGALPRFRETDFKQDVFGIETEVWFFFMSRYFQNVFLAFFFLFFWGGGNADSIALIRFEFVIHQMTSKLPKWSIVTWKQLFYQISLWGMQYAFLQV